MSRPGIAVGRGQPRAQGLRSARSDRPCGRAEGRAVAGGEDIAARRAGSAQTATMAAARQPPSRRRARAGPPAGGDRRGRRRYPARSPAARPPGPPAWRSRCVSCRLASTNASASASRRGTSCRGPIASTEPPSPNRPISSARPVEIHPPARPPPAGHPAPAVPPAIANASSSQSGLRSGTDWPPGSAAARFPRLLGRPRTIRTFALRALRGNSVLRASVARTARGRCRWRSAGSAAGAKPRAGRSCRTQRATGATTWISRAIRRSRG